MRCARFHWRSRTLTGFIFTRCCNWRSATASHGRSRKRGLSEHSDWWSWHGRPMRPILLPRRGTGISSPTPWSPPQRLTESFPDGQLCVDLHGGSAAWRGPLEPLEALHQLLRALAVGDEELPTTVIRAAALYRRLTAGRRVLVVLDNADNAAQVRPLLPGNATCGVLLRGPLGLIALDNSSHLAADALDLGDAIALLRQIIGRARIAAEPEAAAAIVRMSDCRPLALRMHGSYLAARPRLRLGELAPQLRNEHRRQAALRLGDTGVRVAFTLAAEDVGPLAARVLCRLSLLPAPRFARQEVAAVAFDVFAVASAGAVEGGVIAL